MVKSGWQGRYASLTNFDDVPSIFDRSRNKFIEYPPRIEDKKPWSEEKRISTVSLHLLQRLGFLQW